jgi:small subunit ribosomal protein S5
LETGLAYKKDRKSIKEGSDEDLYGNFLETVVKINRCAKVHKGGRKFSFSALVVIGDLDGNVGVGFGKANEVPQSVEKGVKDARKNLFVVPIVNDTIPHRVEGRFCSTKVLLLPASPGTGVIAGAAVRAVVEAAGIKNILTKTFGSTNPSNVVKAAVNGLQQLRTKQQVAQLRGVKVE